MYKKIAFIGVAVLIAPLFSFAQTSNCPTFTPPTILQRGSRDAAPGGQVSQLQRFLVGQRLLTNDSVSGFFGPLTEGAVREFQVSKDLPETGKTDEDTRDFITGMCGGLMPVPSLTASPTILPPPPAVQSATLTWSADNAAECRLRGPNVSETSTGAATGDDRTTSTGVLTKTSVYTLTCENARGTASDFATVAISSGSPRASSCPNVTRLLARGDSGDDVLRLQMFLSGQGVLNIDNATRNFGPLTERALIQLQARHGLTQNGMTDGPTRALMNSLCTATPAPLSCALIAPNNAAPNSDIRLSWSSSRNPGSGILERGGPTPTTTVFTLANATLPEGSTVLTAPATAGTYTYELSVNKAGNTPPTARCSQQVIVGTGAVPSHVTLRAQPASVAEGSATNLTWSAQNATECRLSGPNISETSTGAARTTSTGALTTTSTYTLRCVNASGPASDFLTVIVRGEGTTAACPDITLNLSLGDRNAQVTALQRFLVQMRLLTSDSVSGFFGSVTQTALEQLQTTHGIAVTGTTDARTRALIEGLCHRSSVLPSVTIAASDPAASEASLAVGRYIIRRTGPTTQALAVTVATSGTATRYIDNTTSNPDYSLSGSGIAGGTRRVATIPAGSATTEILLTPRQDILVEGNETSILTLSTGSGYTVGSPSTATVTIADNEVSTGLPSVTITATDAAAAEATTPDIGTYTISRTGATTATLAVNIAAMSGTAVRTTDYTLSGGGIVNPAGTTVTIPAGSANVVVTLTPVDDAAVETGGETAILALSA
ncbi:MAG: peptidoglycan-binding domain-containing protein, partial [bacterium]|nr:peptidoglycan-binding domain-containing protein [bacterium]